MHDPIGNPFDHGTMMDGSAGSWLTGLVVLGALVLVVAGAAALAWVVLHRASTAPTGFGPAPSQQRSEARVVLDARLVRGEVPPEEYTTLRTLLDS